MPAGEKQDVALYGTGPIYNSVGAGTDLLRRFASGAAIAEQVPAWTLGADIGAAASFILAIIPLDQIGIDFGHAAKSGQFASPARALQWTRKYLCESQPLKTLRQSPRD